MIEIEGVSLKIGGASILRDIDLSVAAGRLTALIGPNGAGKSTLLRLIGRLHPLQRGRIAVGGLPVDATPGAVLARSLAILGQDGLAPNRLRVRELVAFGRFPHTGGRLTPKDHAIVDGALDRFELGALCERTLDTLSGGQRQRAAIAMTIAQDTPCILLDEPLNNLDMDHARRTMRILKRLAGENERTIVVVLHDVNQAAAHADRVVALRRGAIVADGRPEEVFTPSVMKRIYDQDFRVETINGMPLVLHHLNA